METLVFFILLISEPYGSKHAFDMYYLSKFCLFVDKMHQLCYISEQQGGIVLLPPTIKGIEPNITKGGFPV